MFKKAVTISLAFLLLLLSVRDLVTFAAFKWHQDVIADKLCVNKYEPIPMCAGQCFLEEQIEANKTTDHNPSSTAQLELSEKLVYSQTLSSAFAIKDAPLSTENGFTYQGLHTTPLVEPVLQPPRLS